MVTLPADPRRPVRIGYGRVPRREDTDAQDEALVAAGCDRVFVDRASGKLARHPELRKALRCIRPGDQLVVTRLDRLAPSLEDLVRLCAELRAREAELVVLDPGFDTSTVRGRMLYEVLDAIAEFNHTHRSERTKDGLAAARAQGRTGGQKPTLSRQQVQTALAMYESGTHTVGEIAAKFGVSRRTIHRHIGKLSD
ncbi:recombinase family protein [Phytohabitans sp. LJ34]|uniref:recombinase family protein n=1 Tax=Phytohabitans sp. LJ34 TaxID=3452217 RepID=UPI003F8B4D6B